jgi:hypothetical protein
LRLTLLFFLSNRISNLGLKNQGKTGGVVRFKREIVQEKNGGLNVLMRPFLDLKSLF